MSVWTLKQHDRYPPLQSTLYDQNGVIDLAGASKVVFVMKYGGTTIEGECEIYEAWAGVVRYPWGSSDTSVIGEYEAEFKIEWPGGIESVPSGEYDTIKILASLDAL